MKIRILIILIVTFYACNQARNKMPITTSSEEARELFIKGRDMWECREQDKANEFLRQAIELDSSFALAYVYYKMPENLRKAARFLDKVSRGETLFIRAGLAYIEGNFELADLFHDSLFIMHPKDEHRWLMAGNVYKNRDVKKAIECYKKAIEINPSHAGAQRRLGIALMGEDRFEEALEPMEKFLDLKPDLGRSALDYAGLLYRMGRLTEALEYCHRVLYQDPTAIYIYMIIAWVYIRLNDFDSALEYCNKLQEFSHTDEENKWVVSMMANVNFIQGDLDKTLFLIDEAIRNANEENNYSEIARLLHLKGWFAMHGNLIDQSIEIFKSGLKLIADSTLLINDRITSEMKFNGALSIAYARVGDMPASDNYLNKARILYDIAESSWANKDFRRVYESANAYYRGDYDLAKSEALVRALNECVLCGYYLAKAYEMSGEIEKAIRWYRHVMNSNYPDFTGLVYNECKTKLEELNQYSDKDGQPRIPSP